jgi:tellurite resistance protein TehA-like permease
MLQRKQSLWLLLAGVSGVLSFYLALFKGTMQDGSKKAFYTDSDFLIFPLIIGLACLAIATIFFFRNRPFQLRLSLIGVLGSVLTLALCIYKVGRFKTVNNFKEVSYQLGWLLPFAMIVFFIMAAYGIYKDEKLMKSLDRLR